MGEGSSDERSEVAGQPSADERSAEWMHLPVSFEELLRGIIGYEP